MSSRAGTTTGHPVYARRADTLASTCVKFIPKPLDKIAQESDLWSPSVFTLRGRCSECVSGRLPLPEALRDELGPLLLAPALQHLEV